MKQILALSQARKSNDGKLALNEVTPAFLLQAHPLTAREPVVDSGDPLDVIHRRSGSCG
jgi:hypothetical protein